MGRTLQNTMINLGIQSACDEALYQVGQRAGLSGMAALVAVTNAVVQPCVAGAYIQLLRGAVVQPPVAVQAGRESGGRETGRPVRRRGCYD